jgi:hypothetical protein
MTETIASEIWGELKRYVNTVDRAEAAETLVNILIDNDISADDIKSAFKSDSDIKKALASYLHSHEEEYDEEEEEYDEEDDYEDND